MRDRCTDIISKMGGGGEEAEIYKLAIIITEKCSLRCKYCTEYMPDIAGIAKHTDIEICKRSVGKLLDTVGKLDSLTILGGELFLHPHWDEFVRWCIDDRRIKNVVLLTNATIMPSNWKVMQNDKVVLALDDYGDVSLRLSELKECAKKHGVNYAVYRHTHWFDVTGYSLVKQTEGELCRKYETCQIKGCWNISDGFLYKCTTSFYKMKYMVRKNIEGNSDFIDLLHQDTDAIRKAIERLSGKDYLDACKYCAGTGNENMIGVARQVR